MAKLDLWLSKGCGFSLDAFVPAAECFPDCSRVCLLFEERGKNPHIPHKSKRRPAFLCCTANKAAGGSALLLLPLGVTAVNGNY